MLWSELFIQVNHYVALVMAMFCQGNSIKKSYLLIDIIHKWTVMCNKNILINIQKVNLGIRICWNTTEKLAK